MPLVISRIHLSRPVSMRASGAGGSRTEVLIVHKRSFAPLRRIGRPKENMAEIRRTAPFQTLVEQVFGPNALESLHRHQIPRRPARAEAGPTVNAGQGRSPGKSAAIEIKRRKFAHDLAVSVRSDARGLARMGS